MNGSIVSRATVPGFTVPGPTMPGFTVRGPTVPGNIVPGLSSWGRRMVSSTDLSSVSYHNYYYLIKRNISNKVVKSQQKQFLTNLIIVL